MGKVCLPSPQAAEVAGWSVRGLLCSVLLKLKGISTACATVIACSRGTRVDKRRFWIELQSHGCLINKRRTVPETGCRNKVNGAVLGLVFCQSYRASASRGAIATSRVRLQQEAKRKSQPDVAKLFEKASLKSRLSSGLDKNKYGSAVTYSWQTPPTQRKPCTAVLGGFCALSPSRLPSYHRPGD